MLKIDAPEEVKPLLEIHNLSVSFSSGKQKVQALNDVSLSLLDSEVYCVVGESGSGKTTLARCIARLETPSSGIISYSGTVLSKLKGQALRKYRKAVQIIFQDPFESFNPRESIFTALSTPMSLLAGEKRRDVQVEMASRLLMEVGMKPEETLYKFPHQLSGGEKQRINIARALVPQPRLLIADEPVTMIDASQKLEILSLLLDLKKRYGLTILLITHDLATAKIMGERIGIMYLGSFVEIGIGSAILTKAHHPYTELILSSTPELSSASLFEDGEEISITHFEGMRSNSGCSFRTRCKYVTAKCEEVKPQLEEKSLMHLAACHNPLNKT